MQESHNYDVAIIGAGIAGCHLAQMLANQQFSVALIDRKPINAAGPDWINAVPLWMFDEALLMRPAGNELFDLNNRFIIRAPNKRARLIVNDLFVADVNMHFLGNRLKQKFLNAQQFADIVTGQVNRADFDSRGRMVKVFAEHNGQEIPIKAKVFVDSAGIKGVLRKLHPLSSKLWPVIDRQDCCTAAQRTLEIKDRYGAEKFLSNNKFIAGDILADVGVVGGYSMFRYQINEKFNQISLLCGVRAVPEYKNANAVIEEFIGHHKWIGSHFIDGRGMIPLNAPYHQLVASGLALLGDSACQVDASHGSGIGIGLIAAKILATTLIEARNRGRDIGDVDVIRAYPQEFHRRFYRRLYFSEHFRKFSQHLSSEEMSSLIESGLLNASLAKQTLKQEDFDLKNGSFLGLGLGAIKSPRLFCSLMPIVAKSFKGARLARKLSMKAL